MKLLNVVILAENYPKLINWYKTTLKLEILIEETGEYHYAELGFDKKVILGITPATEVKHKPTVPRNNSAVMLLSVNDLSSVLERVNENGGKTLLGPSKDEKYDFIYGAFADTEGNEVWLVEETSK